MNDTPHDPVTGEIIEDDRGLDARRLVAADGLPVARRSGHVADVLRMLEDGQFNADASVEMRALVEAMVEYGKGNKGSAKGKLTITLDLSLANGILVTVPEVTIKKPKAKRSGTALFAGELGTLGRNPENQTALFGARPPLDPFEEQQRREVRDAS